MPLLLAVSRAGADIAVSLIGTLFLIHSTRQKNWQWLSKPEIKAMGMLWLYLVIQSLFLSVPDMQLRAVVWIRFLLLYAAISCWLLVNVQDIRRAALVAFPIIVFLLVDTYWQYLTGTSLSGKPYPHENRLGGPMSHPNIGNLLLKVTLPFIGVWLLLAKEDKPWLKWLLPTLIIAWIAIFPLTGERSSTLLLFAGVATISAFLFVKQKQFRVYVFAALGFMSLLILLLLNTQHVVKLRATQLAHQIMDLSNTVYGQLYNNAFYLWHQQPLWGIGYGRFKEECPTIMILIHTTYCDAHPHNIYLELLSETGTLGAALFIIAVGLIVKSVLLAQKNATKDNSNLYIFSIATFVILLWPAIVTQSIFSNWPAMLFWYSISLAACIPRMLRQP